MARKVTIWRIWDGCDMAGSDQFFATKKEAERALQECYGISCVELKPDGDGGLSIDVPKYGDVHFESVNIELTRENIATALRYLPHR